MTANYSQSTLSLVNLCPSPLLLEAFKIAHKRGTETLAGYQGVKLNLCDHCPSLGRLFFFSGLSTEIDYLLN